MIECVLKESIIHSEDIENHFLISWCFVFDFTETERFIHRTIRI